MNPSARRVRATDGNSLKIMKKLITIAIACSLVSPAFAQSPATAPPLSAALLCAKGQAAEKAGDPDSAKEFYTQALKLEPNNPNARYSLGQLKIHSAEIAARGREAKFGSVMVPLFQMDAVPLKEALDALAASMEKQSKGEVTPNFVVQDTKQILADRKITLNLKNMPSKAVMKYVLDQAGAKVKYDEHAVVVTPL